MKTREDELIESLDFWQREHNREKCRADALFKLASAIYSMEFLSALTSEAINGSKSDCPYCGAKVHQDHDYNCGLHSYGGK